MHTPMPDIIREVECASGRELTEREFECALNTGNAATAERLRALWQAYRAAKARLACITLQG